MVSLKYHKALDTRKRKAEQSFVRELAMDLACSKNAWNTVDNLEAKALALRFRRAASTIQTAYLSHLDKVKDIAKTNAASRAGKEPSTYWKGHGKYQDEYDALWRFVPPVGNTRVPHIQLFLNVHRVYHEYYNNGNDTFYAIWDNGRYDSTYSAPEDAPSMVKDFFNWGRQTLKQKDYYDSLDEEDTCDEPDFCEGILEELMDETIRWVFERLSCVY